MADIKQRFVVEADEGIAKLKAVSEATIAVGDATETAGEATEGATPKIRENSKAMEEAGDRVADMVTQWVSFGAVVPAIISWLDEINKKMIEGNKIAIELGKNMQGLSANIGGKEAYKLTDDLIGIANQSGFDDKGMMELGDFVSAATDMRPDMSEVERIELAQQAALMQRATGVGGSRGFALINTIGQNYSLTDAQSVDFATGLLNSGMSESVITDFASKGADPKFMALAYAAREKLPIDVGGRQVNSLIAAVRKDDGKGGIAPELAEIGITEQMTPYQRFEQVLSAHKSGQINDAQRYSMLGGQTTEAFVRAVAPIAADRQAVDDAMAGLLDPDLAEGEVAKKLENPNYRRYERDNRRRLMVWTDKYKSKVNQGEQLEQAEADFDVEDTPGWMRKLGKPFVQFHAWAQGSDEGVENADKNNRSRIDQIIGRDPVKAMQLAASEDELRKVMPRGVGESGSDGTGGAVIIHQQINITNSTVNTKDPIADKSPAQEQD